METIDQIAQELVILFPKIIRGARGGFSSQVSVTLPQIQILMAVQDLKANASISTLAHLRKVSLPTVTGLTERLIRQKLMERFRPEGDRRKVILRLTPQGQKVTGSFLNAITDRWKNVLHHLTPPEQKAFLKAVRRIVEIIDTTEGGQSPIHGSESQPLRKTERATKTIQLTTPNQGGQSPVHGSHSQPLIKTGKAIKTVQPTTPNQAGPSPVHGSNHQQPRKTKPAQRNPERGETRAQLALFGEDSKRVSGPNSEKEAR